MTIIMGTCPRCRDVSLNPARVQLRVHLVAGFAQYLFQCPSCGTRVLKPAPDQVVEALERAGVSPVLVEPPAELDEPRRGPPICADDLLALRELLRGDAWHEELAALGGG
jgi:hypothetical protein